MNRSICSMSDPSFFRRAYHDIRNPIVVIQGYASLMLEGCGGKLSEEHKEWVLDIKRNVDYLLRLVNNLALLSSIESGIAAKENEDTRLKDVINSAIACFERDIKRKNLEIEIPEIDDTISVLVDKGLIQQAFSNIIQNAIIYSKEGSKITLSIKESDDSIFFSVSDTGPGIEESLIENLDRGFLKGERGDEYKGTGLGIFISKKIAQLYGGTLILERNSEEGSTFTLSIRKAEQIE